MLKTFAWLALIAGLIYLRFFSSVDTTWLVVVVVLMELVVLVKVVRTIWQAKKLVNSSNRQQHIEQALKGLFPDKLAKFMITEISIMLAAVDWARRCPLPSHEGNHYFTSVQKGQYSFILLAVVLLSMIEVPVAHILTYYWLEGTAAHVAHVLLILIHVYGYIWIIGDYRLLLESHHSLEENGLHIELGARCHAFIAFENLQSVAFLKPGNLTVELEGVVKVTPYDDPNVMIKVNEPITIQWILGFKKTCSEFAIYLDDPHDFVAALQEHLPQDETVAATQS